MTNRLRCLQVHGSGVFFILLYFFSFGRNSQLPPPTDDFLPQSYRSRCSPGTQDNPRGQQRLGHSPSERNLHDNLVPLVIPLPLFQLSPHVPRLGVARPGERTRYGPAIRGLEPEPALAAEIALRLLSAVTHPGRGARGKVLERCESRVVEQRKEGKQGDNGRDFVQREEGDGVGDGGRAEGRRVDLEALWEAVEDAVETGLLRGRGSGGGRWRVRGLGWVGRGGLL